VTRVVSRQNPRYREIVRLVGSSRERRKSGRCVLEGEHLVTAYLDRVGTPDTVVASEDAIARPGVAALVARVPPANAMIVPQALFDAMGALLPDIGVIAVGAAPRVAPAGRGSLVLLVEAIQDPGNLGSMLRSAAAFGASDVYLSKECAFAWSPKVLRAGQGAHFHLAIREDADLARRQLSFAAKAPACSRPSPPAARRSTARRWRRVSHSRRQRRGGPVGCAARGRRRGGDDPDAGRHRVAQRGGRDGGRALRDRATPRHCCGPALIVPVSTQPLPSGAAHATSMPPLDVRRRSEIATVVSVSPQV
jgi:TrmH family RNA methyltransferase